MRQCCEVLENIREKITIIFSVLCLPGCLVLLQSDVFIFRSSLFSKMLFEE